MESEYIEANTGARIMFFAFVLLSLVLVIFGDNLARILLPENIFLSYDALKEDTKIADDRIFWVWLVMTVISWVLAAYLMRIAIRAIKSQQWPAPGMKMPFRTKIYRGRGAKYSGVGIGVVASWFLIKPIVLLSVMTRFSISAVL